jgi:hypothetical protein
MILSAAGNLLVFIYMSTPLNELMLAIARVSGESNHGPLPNPSDQKNIKSGLRPALEAIYALDRAPITMPQVRSSPLMASCDHNSYFQMIIHWIHGSRSVIHLP